MSVLSRWATCVGCAFMAACTDPAVTTPSHMGVAYGHTQPMGQHGTMHEVCRIQANRLARASRAHAQPSDCSAQAMMHAAAACMHTAQTMCACGLLLTC